MKTTVKRKTRTETVSGQPAASAHYFPVFTEWMQDGAIAASTSGVIHYCNRRFAELVQLPAEGIPGTSIDQYLPEYLWQEILSLHADGSLADSGVQHEAVLQREGGEGVPVKVTSARVPHDSSTVCLLVTDLSAQRAHHEMRVARDVAEKASLARDEFLAALSHELRTPLTPALMAATVLEKDTGLPEAARSDIALIRRNIELEARLIDDLLDLTLITHGKLRLQLGELDLHTALNRAIEVGQNEARQKQLNLKIALNAYDTTLYGDAIRVQQVFWNVLRNAIKFTPEGGTIAISTGNDIGRAWVRVVDSGIGFPQDASERIFQPFEQAGRQVNRQFGGLGLGLAISRAIVQVHGGHIRGDSAGPGSGATFTIELPLSKYRASGAVAGKSAGAREPGMDILLVEDHRDTRNCLRQVLEVARHKVLTAGTAAEALNLAARHRFNLVISDLGLPDMNGHELMRQLHERFGLSGIALSGYGMEEDVTQSHEAGFKHHLTKPVSFDQLRSLVAEFANR